MIVIGIDPSLASCGVSDGTHHELVKTSPGAEDVDALEDLDRRCLEIATGLADFINRHCCKEDKIALCIEAPMLSAHGSGAHTLFEMGWLYNDILSTLPTSIIPAIVTVHRVPSPTLRKFATGKGNTKKDDMKVKVFRKFGIEFEKDPGADKLFAFLLSKFGTAIIDGEVDFTSSKRRGAGTGAKAAVRRTLRVKGVA